MVLQHIQSKLCIRSLEAIPVSRTRQAEGVRQLCISNRQASFVGWSKIKVSRRTRIQDLNLTSARHDSRVFCSLDQGKEWKTENPKEKSQLSTQSKTGAELEGGLPQRALSIVTLSGGFMVMWCLAPFPGSVWVDLPWHDNLVHSLWTNPIVGFDPLIGPESLMLKYNILGRAPSLLHALPGAIWCALAPLQLARAGSGKTRKTAHTIGGRVMLGSAAVLMLGYALIDANNLTAEDFDFGGSSGSLAALIDNSPLGQLLPLTFSHAGLKVIAAWFIFTGVQTITRARAKDWDSHRAWAIRHVGAGLWVAAQRPLFSVARALQYGFLGSDLAADATAQADAFYTCAYICTILYFLGAEAIIRNIWLPTLDTDEVVEPIPVSIFPVVSSLDDDTINREDGDDLVRTENSTNKVRTSRKD